MMRNRYLLLFGFCCTTASVFAQTSITCTDTVAARIMMGTYNPAAYLATTIIDNPNAIASGVNSAVSADSLHTYLRALQSFGTRNTGSDTTSASRGIGAARRWIFDKFSQFGSRNEGRLLPAYLQFDMDICSVQQHRNVLAVLPGTDTADKSVIIIEAHMDSRCAGLCDTACLAAGMEDNGSGTALVIELARVMSGYSYKRTIVFTTTIAEEQGLSGAQAFATYCRLHDVKVKAVLNNDVVGGILCGHTASPPGCPSYNEVDSTQFRLFSSGGFNSPHKGLCRYIKLEYKEMIRPIVSVPMAISIMTPEDRTGRGGDHIPFRREGFPAMRFTAANESGDADVSSSSYTDRQHTSADSLGKDADGDGVTDTFFVDFNYLARNTVINGNAAGMIGIAPMTPDFTVSSSGDGLTINIITHPEYLNYRIGVRTTTNDWDSVYAFTGSLTHTLPLPHASYIVSVAAVDDKGVESLFSQELMAKVNSVDDVSATAPTVELLQNKPNPADEATMISVKVNEQLTYKEAYITICDINGREVKRTPIVLNSGINEIMYDHGYNMSGTYLYTLIVDGQKIATRRMLFTN